jgi:hypothetical protein
MTDRMQSASLTGTIKLILCREIIAVYCENHVKHLNTMFGQNAELLNDTIVGTCNCNCALYS